MKFKNVDAVQKANIYYEGRVTSRTLEFNDGSTKTMGIMLEGQYNFGTDKKEIMEIVQGDVKIKLPGDEVAHTHSSPYTFEVPANSSFDIEAIGVVDYTCSYLD